MNKEFIPYTEALELKQLGFDEPCFGYYVDGELRGINLGMEELGGVKPYYQRFGFHVLNNHDIDNPNKVVVTAPTYSQAFLFFRDKHGLYVHSVPEFYLDGINFNWQILWYLPKDQWVKDEDGRVRTFTEGTMLYGDNGEYPTQEEADLACLKKMIEITK
jgi:hypothetical protein